MDDSLRDLLPLTSRSKLVASSRHSPGGLAAAIVAHKGPVGERPASSMCHAPVREHLPCRPEHCRGERSRSGAPHVTTLVPFRHLAPY